MNLNAVVQHNALVLEDAGAPEPMQLAEMLSRVSILAAEKPGQHHQWQRKVSGVRIPSFKDVRIQRIADHYHYRPLLVTNAIPAEDLHLWVDGFYFGFKPGQGWELVDQEPSREIVRGAGIREYTEGKELCEVVDLAAYTHLFWYAKRRGLSRGFEMEPYDKFVLAK